jgi:hypothetical protein
VDDGREALCVIFFSKTSTDDLGRVQLSVLIVCQKEVLPGLRLCQRLGLLVGGRPVERCDLIRLSWPLAITVLSTQRGASHWAIMLQQDNRDRQTC